MSLSVGVVCERGIGPERGGRLTNEDNFLVATDGRLRMRHHMQHEPTNMGLLAAVADGMGGVRGGELASRSAVEWLTALARPGQGSMTARSLLQHVREGHRELHGRLRDSPQPGTTLTLFRAMGDRASWVSVGDSRIYRLRAGELEQLSRDHTRNEFHQRDGTPLMAAGDGLCQGFILGSRGLGFDNMIRLEPALDADTVLLRGGDTFALTSDGVHDALSPETLTRLLGLETPQASAQALHDAAIAAGSTDNLTALVVRVDGMLPIVDVPPDDESIDTINF